MSGRLRFLRHDDTHASWNDDPLSGVANLFDVSLAFIVAMAIALFSILGNKDMLSADASWTLTRTAPDGHLEVVSKQGRQIKVSKVTDRQLSGNGERLGIAYQLPNGQVIYVPEGGKAP